MGRVPKINTTLFVRRLEASEERSSPTQDQDQDQTKTRPRIETFQMYAYPTNSTAGRERVTYKVVHGDSHRIVQALLAFREVRCLDG